MVRTSNQFDRVFLLSVYYYVDFRLYSFFILPE